MTLLSFFENHYKPRRLLGKSAETSRLYRISIRNFAATLGREPELSDLTDDNLIRHMQRMIDAGRANATANKDRNQLLTLWRHAHRTQLVESWPSVPELPQAERVPRAWLADEARQLLTTASRLTGTIGQVSAAIWWSAIIHVCLDTG